MARNRRFGLPQDAPVYSSFPQKVLPKFQGSLRHKGGQVGIEAAPRRRHDPAFQIKKNFDPRCAAADSGAQSKRGHRRHQYDLRDSGDRGGGFRIFRRLMLFQDSNKAAAMFCLAVQRGIGILTLAIWLLLLS